MDTKKVETAQKALEVALVGYATAVKNYNAEVEKTSTTVKGTKHAKMSLKDNLAGITSKYMK